MADYMKVLPSFWTGETGKVLRGYGRDAQHAALYLITCELAAKAPIPGLYHISLPTLCHEAAFTPATARRALAQVAESGFAYYDEPSELAWIPELARIQIDEYLHPKDKRVIGIMRTLRPFLKYRYGRDFYRRYEKPFNLPHIIIDMEGEAPPFPLVKGFVPPSSLTDNSKQITATDNRELQQTTNNSHEERRTENELQQGTEPDETTAIELRPAAEVPRIVPTQPTDVAGKFVACFNAALERHVGLTPEIAEKTASLLRTGYRSWMIVALPILVDANGLDARYRRAVAPAHLLRDGKHPRTSNGQTTGATHWLERELQRADRTVLDARLRSIAEQFGVLEQLQQIGVGVRTDSGL